MKGWRWTKVSDLKVGQILPLPTGKIVTPVKRNWFSKTFLGNTVTRIIYTHYRVATVSTKFGFTTHLILKAVGAPDVVRTLQLLPNRKIVYYEDMPSD